MLREDVANVSAEVAGSGALARVALQKLHDRLTKPSKLLLVLATEPSRLPGQRVLRVGEFFKHLKDVPGHDIWQTSWSLEAEQSDYVLTYWNSDQCTWI